MRPEILNSSSYWITMVTVFAAIFSVINTILFYSSISRKRKKLVKEIIKEYRVLIKITNKFNETYQRILTLEDLSKLDIELKNKFYKDAVEILRDFQGLIFEIRNKLSKSKLVKKEYAFIIDSSEELERLALEVTLDFVSKENCTKIRNDLYRFNEMSEKLSRMLNSIYPKWDDEKKQMAKTVSNHPQL